MNYILVALGGAIGSLFRYILSINMPKSTLLVNVIGSFVIGIFSFYFIDKLKIRNEYVLLIKVGLCGGFTTFSTFSLESFDLMQKNKILAIIYMLASFVLCILAIYCSKWISSSLSKF